ncbi:MAG: hypothetical protein HYX61_06610 [Gammaproteobacteria bacterium]|jgi:CheY-like chemotaxis protein|nr:hypothetical protein [Gammaproteobacteria bacterium]
MLAWAKPKILLLDDDSSFLDVATYYLEKRSENTAIISKFNTSKNFLDHIYNHCYLPENIHDIIREFYSRDISKTYIEQTLKDLAELPAMLIIDHHLRNEDTNGIEISKTIREFVENPFIILLTAEVDTNKALDLHNNQIIDVFVRKDAKDPMDDIYSHISKHIAKQVIECSINTEEAFSSNEILGDLFYIKTSCELLNALSYKSHLTISANGDIAVLDVNDQIKYYSYNNGVFSLNG